MEPRNVTLTLDKAKEFYNSGNKALKEIALQAYTKDELTGYEWQNIKTFEDACIACNLNPFDIEADLNKFDYWNFEGNTGRHLKAIYKLDIIRKALNGDWNPSLIEGRVHYSFVKFYPAGKEAIDAASSNNGKLGKTFKTDGKEYTLVGEATTSARFGGLTNFGCGYGDVQPYLSLFSCKSREIAEHMSRYFSKEIFEATYIQYTEIYEWID